MGSSGGAMTRFSREKDLILDLKINLVRFTVKLSLHVMSERNQELTRRTSHQTMNAAYLLPGYSFRQMSGRGSTDDRWI